MSKLLKLTLPLFTLLISNAMCGLNHVLINPTNVQVQFNKLLQYITNMLDNSSNTSTDNKCFENGSLQEATNALSTENEQSTNAKTSLDELLQDITEGNGKKVENYLLQYYKDKLRAALFRIDKEDDLKPHIKLVNETINKAKVKVDNNEMKQFQECIKNENTKKYPLMLSESLLNNYLYNISEFKFVSEKEDANSINVWQYFNAMKNALQTSLNKNGSNKQTIKALYYNIFEQSLQLHNESLNKIADLYIDYKISNDSSKIKEFLKDNKYNIDEQSLLNNFLNFYTLGFTDIINKIVKGTLVLHNELPNLKINNKALTDNYDRQLDDNTKYIIKIENYDIGRCWFDTAFEIVYTAAINSCNNDLLKNTFFGKFIMFLEELQKNRAKYVKKQGGKEITYVETKSIPGGVQTITHFAEISDHIDIWEAFTEFEIKMHQANILSTWNAQEGVQQAKEELHKMIDENRRAKEERMARIKGCGNSSNNNNSNISGSDTQHGINLLSRVFPELKQILIPTYDVDTSNLDSKAEDSTCGNMVDNRISSFGNVVPKDLGNEKNKHEGIKAHYSSSYLPINKLNINIILDKLTTGNIKHIKELPEYIVVNGLHYKNNNNDAKSGMKFDKELHERIVGFNEKSELVIAELSSMAMGRSDAEHAYALYKGNDGWYIMDDNSKKDNNLYKKLTTDEFDKIVKKDKVEAFVYKKLYCKPIDENNNHEANNSNTTNNTQADKKPN